jgi:tetratricopeptide (TPR) repeat protein
MSPQGPLGRFASAPRLDRTAADRILSSLKAGWRPAIRKAVWNQVWDEFDRSGFRHCAQCEELGDLDLHHIIPLRQAFLIYDLEHDYRNNLIPLCGACHRAADGGRLSRQYLRQLRSEFRADSSRKVIRKQPTTLSDPEIAIASGVRPSSLVSRRGAANVDKGDAAKLVALASVERRAARTSADLRRCLQHLESAKKLAIGNDAVRALIAYHQGKVFRLCGARVKALEHYSQSIEMAKEAGNEIGYKIAQYARDWLDVYGTSSGEPRPDAVQLGDHGLSWFSCDLEGGSGSWLSAKWYAYALFDRAQGLAARRDYGEAISCLAEVEYWADALGLEGLRPFLYRILADSFHANDDLWRMLLASSISVRLHSDRAIREDAGLAIKTHLQALHDLRRFSDFKRVSESSCRIVPEMGNLWALERIHEMIGSTKP